MTRIFFLTHGQQNLTREITTPSIPPFITACLNIITIRISSQDVRRVDVYGSSVNPVLQAFIRLLPQHPSAFRPFIAQIRSIIAPLLAPTPSSLPTKESLNKAFESPSRESVALAQRLLALLPYSAPKNTSGEEWTKSLNTVLAQAHRTANHVFRAVVEDWIPRGGSSSDPVDSRTFGQVVGDVPDDQLSLPGWRGIDGGVERLVGLVELLQAHMASTTASAVSIPLGLIGSLLERLLSVIGPSISNANDGYDAQPRTNPEIGRDERDRLWSGLPLIHGAAIDLLSLLILRLHGQSVAFAQGSLDLILWVLRSNVHEAKIRKSTYRAVSQILVLIGPSMSQSTVSSLSLLIQACCEDILPPNEPLNRTLNSSNRSGSKVQHNDKSADNVDSFLKPGSSIARNTAPKDVHDAASALLPLLLSKLPKQYLSRPLRGQLDRTAIIIGHKDAMVASVLNPLDHRNTDSKRGSRSILPHLARAYSDASEVEAILRPRLPVLKPRCNHTGEPESEDEHAPIRSVLKNTNEYRGSGDLLYHDNERPQGTFGETHGVSSATFTTANPVMPQSAHSQANDSQMHTSAMLRTLDLTKRPRNPDDPQDPDASISIAPDTYLQDASAPQTKRVKLDDKVFIVPTKTSTTMPSENLTIATQEQQESPANITLANLSTLETRYDPETETSAARPENSDDTDSNSNSSLGSEVPPIDPTLNSDLFKTDDEYEEGDDGDGEEDLDGDGDEVMS